MNEADLNKPDRVASLLDWRIVALYRKLERLRQSPQHVALIERIAQLETLIEQTLEARAEFPGGRSLQA